MHNLFVHFMSEEHCVSTFKCVEKGRIFTLSTKMEINVFHGGM